ncbi:MAG: adenosylmethionine--8-amino-7-oxononanoate transaminase [Deltaproteobacteria bacterium]|nr:adenosylmethionine--8-amino-7-oxononanoate transaminase [Deltaproteobacteria bacterium]
MSLPNPEELVAWDHAYLWHPFTQMQEWLEQPPLIIERGDGPYLIDVHGRRYLDGVSSLWCNVHGHRHPKLDAALRDQLDRIAHTTLLGLAGSPSIVLAKRLVELLPPNLTRVFYSDAGATAVEIALKLAFQYWQLRGETRRTHFASLTEAYHGDTLGAVSVGYSEAFHRHYKPLLFDCHKINPPHVYRWERQVDPEAALGAAIGDAEELFELHGHEIAALIIEPLMQGAAGMWVQPVEYVRALREITRRHGVLLICDEVATGFGRTGTMFAIEQAKIEPDLMCVGKGITGGYLPLAATFASNEIFEAFLGPYAELKAFFHGHTYTGNALACAVANSNLDVFVEERVLANVVQRSRQLTERLARDFAPLPHVGDIRQVGLMAGIELVADRRSRRTYPSAERIGMKVILEARQHGVILRPLGNVLILMPPLCIRADELDRLCNVAAAAIKTVTGA